jgi:hypothetical protein
MFDATGKLPPPGIFKGTVKGALSWESKQIFRDSATNNSFDAYTHWRGKHVYYENVWCNHGKLIQRGIFKGTYVWQKFYSAIIHSVEK